jgi:hypothetical protein
VTRHRVLIDIEFTVDDDRFKLAHLRDDAIGVSDVTDVGVRDAVTGVLVHTDWANQGLAPLRSIVTSRPLTKHGYEGSYIPADSGVDAAPDQLG